jgi:superfamily II DNA or RNA helicase
VNRFSCRYRIGVSATPNKTGDFALATNVIGPVFHETKRKDVDALIDPVVFKIPTGFRHKYSGRADYPRVLASLIADNDRNRLIVKTILMQENCHGLVVSKRLEHLKTLAAMLQGAGYEWPTMMLTGEESSEDRKEVVEQITSYPGIVFSTLADEALDIPRLDSLFLVFPQRNPGLITQQAGRVCRVHSEKPDAKVFDFCDTKVGPLDAQWRVRRIQVWQANGYEIVTVRPADILEYEHE